MARVLIVDDEPSVREMLGVLLHRAGYTCQSSSGARAARERIATEAPYDAVVTDLTMPDGSGMDVLAAARERDPHTQVIMITAYATTEQAVDAMRKGAYDYIQKPFRNAELLATLEKALEKRALVDENRALRAEREGDADGIIGSSDAMQRVRRLVERVADAPSSVLITGESGTGKEVVARALHFTGQRGKAPFVVVNCGALPEALMESELFGHEKGAFTGAAGRKKGLFQEADTGTLFLDEIGELPLALQVKLLRVLQEGTIRPVGDVRDKAVKVRVVAATVRDLEHEVKEGRFREDLFYRLNVLQIVAPPLRERAEDVLLLAEHFIARCNSRLGTDVRGLDAAAKKRLVQYPFPGNVRELENLIERAVVLTEGQLLTESDLPDRVREPTDAVAAMLASGELSIKKTQRFIEESLIRKALEKTQGNRTQASKLLEISHRALLYKIKDYGLG